MASRAAGHPTARDSPGSLCPKIMGASNRMLLLLLMPPFPRRSVGALRAVSHEEPEFHKKEWRQTATKLKLPKRLLFGCCHEGHLRQTPLRVEICHRLCVADHT